MNAVGKVINGKFEEYANNRGGRSQDLSELAGRVTTAEGDIDALESKTDANEESITTIEGTLSRHRITLDDLAEKVADILLHKISADKVLTAEAESAYTDDTFLMSGKKTASLIAQLNGNFSIESIPVNTGLICYKFGKIVMANITKEITLVVGWNTLSTAVPETINRTFGVCETSDGVTFGMISVSGTTLQVEFPNSTAGKTITVRGSIVYFTK